MKYKVSLSPFLLAVVFSPALFQTIYSCERGDTYLLTLAVEVAGQNQISGFNPNNRDYAIVLDSDTALLSTISRDPLSTVTYQWIVNGISIESGDIGVGGGDVTVNVPPGQSTLRVAVRAAPPETAVGAYTISVERVDPVPLSVAMIDNITSAVFIFPYNLDVVPTSPITAGQSFTADLGGSVELTEQWVDYMQAAIPGGTTGIVIDDLKATVQTRGGGATGADVALGWTYSGSSRCLFGGTACDPANDNPDGSNSECVPTGSFNPCQQITDLPISTDCTPGGVCDGLGKLNTQCASNGFCATGGLVLPLDPVLGASYLAGDGVSPGQTEALFGWADNPPPATAVGVPSIDGDGTWNMLGGSSYPAPVGELGIKLNTGGLFVSLEGVMGVDSNGPAGVGVPYDASPMPDSSLVSFPVTQPSVSCANLVCNFTTTSSAIKNYYVPSIINPADETLPWSGSVNIDCQPNGAQCDCTADLTDTVGPITLPGIGDLCLVPMLPGACPTGTISCDAGTDKNITQTQRHDIGSCIDNPGCRTDCDAHCATLGAVRVANSPACEGFCRTADTAMCWGDDDTNPPLPGFSVCPAGDTCDELTESIGHDGMCGCQCIDVGDGAPAGPGEALLHIGFAVEIFFDNDGDGIAEQGVGPDGLACTADDEDAPGTLPAVCVPYTTSTASTYLPDAGYLDPMDPFVPITGVIDPPDTTGAPFTCTGGIPSTAIGAVLQGAWTEKDSRRYDLASMITITCE